MDTETRREIERLRDDAIRKCAQVQEVSELILTIASSLLGEDSPPHPVPHRRPHPHLRRVKALLIGAGALAAGWGARRAVTAAAITAATVAPLVAVPLILSTPAPPGISMPVHHLRRREPAPAPSGTRPPAASQSRGPARPGRAARNATRPASSPAVKASPSPLPSPLVSVSVPPPPAQCTLSLLGICVNLGAH